MIMMMSACSEFDEELCDGRPPLVDPVTGREYDCDEGRDRCPPDSYCHKTTVDQRPVARCCSEGLLSIE